MGINIMNLTCKEGEKKEKVGSDRDLQLIKHMLHGNGYQ